MDMTIPNLRVVDGPASAIKGLATIDMIDDEWLGEKVPIDAIPDPQLWNVVVKQIAIKKRVGNILLPDQTISDQEWTHGLCMVIKVGPAVYRGKKFEDMEITPEMAPKPGDIYKFKARTPERFQVDGETFIEVADDALTLKVDRKAIDRIAFKI